MSWDKQDAAREEYERTKPHTLEEHEQMREQAQRDEDHEEALREDAERAEYEAEDEIVGFSQADWDAETATGALDDDAE